MLANLERNVYQFSAAKNYHMLKELTLALKDGDTLRTFEQFRAEASGILGTWVGTWLKTEYTTAVGGAQMAGKWLQIQENKETLPYLEFFIVGDERTCAICLPFDGLTRHVDDPVWNYAMPLLHFGDRCTVKQHAAATITPDHAIPGDGDIPAMFRVNLAKENLVFPPDHPYYDGIPKRTLNKWVKQNKPDRSQSK